MLLRFARLLAIAWVSDAQPRKTISQQTTQKSTKEAFSWASQNSGANSKPSKQTQAFGCSIPPCTRPFDCPILWLLSTAPNTVVLTPAGTCSGAYLQDHLCHLELLLGDLVRAHGLVEEQAEHVVLLQGLLVVLLIQVDHSVFPIVGGEIQSLFCFAAEKQVKTCQNPASRLHRGALGVQQRAGKRPSPS